MDLIITNIGILDNSYNTFFAIPNNNSGLNYFGATMYANRLYFNCLNTICSIDINTKSFRIDIKNIDRGTHYIVIIEGFIYIQETYYNRIKRFNIDINGNIDQNSCFICPIYKFSLNPNLIANDLLFSHSNVTNNDYRHINSLCYIPDISNTLICSSSFLRNGNFIDGFPTNNTKNSTIDFIDMASWTYIEIPVPAYAIHDLLYYQNYLYFLGTNSIHRIDPFTKTYIDKLYEYTDISGSSISRGLSIENNIATFYINPIISRNNNSNTNTITNTIKIIIDLSTNTLIEHTTIEKITIFSCVKI